MSKHANPTLIGAFVLGALLLATTSVILLGGGNFFQKKHLHIMYFDGSAQGLQVGSPVLFLGVRIGTVNGISLGLNEANHRYLVQVTCEIESRRVRTSSGKEINLQDSATFRQLIDQGLRARLRMQSLLTGQLYVDLDFYPDKPAKFFSSDPRLGEIPTIPSTTDELANKYESFPVDKFLKDLVNIGESLNTILASKEMQSIPGRLEEVLAHLDSLSAKIDQGSEPLMAELRSNLKGLTGAVEATRQAMVKTQGAADRVGTATERFGPVLDRIGSAADRVGSAADRVGAAVNNDSPLVQEMTKASVQVRQAAQSLQELAGTGSPTAVRLQEALQEVDRAARALRSLAESLENQPESLLRGKSNREE